MCFSLHTSGKQSFSDMPRLSPGRYERWFYGKLATAAEKITKTGRQQRTVLPALTATAAKSFFVFKRTFSGL
jgi:hypothetical protein